MRLELELKQKQKLTQHMVQSMEILQMNTQELDVYLDNLALENPMVELEERHSDSGLAAQDSLRHKLEWMESTDYQNRVYYRQEHSDMDMEQNWHDKRDMEKELGEYLLSQIVLAEYSKLERTILETLIQSLDSCGYLREDLSIFADMFHVSEDVILQLLYDIQGLDPAGVGARDISECLILQLHREKDIPSFVYDIIENHLELVAKNHLPTIAKTMMISMEQVQYACEKIKRLNPKPGSCFSNRDLMRYVIPDVLVVKLENKFEILLNESHNKSFTINDYYRQLLNDNLDVETKSYLQSKLSQAEQVQKNIAMRSSTLSKVMHVLVEHQKDFFVEGIGNKKPMKLSDISEEIGVHESTVSRTLRGKYLQCTWGVFPLNYFLTTVAVKETLQTDEMTPEQIKRKIQELIDEEDKKKPLSDQKISDELKKQFIDISRRTVNKYRVEMGIPDKSGRKVW